MHLSTPADNAGPMTASATAQRLALSSVRLASSTLLVRLARLEAAAVVRGASREDMVAMREERGRIAALFAELESKVATGDEEAIHSAEELAKVMHTVIIDGSPTTSVLGKSVAATA